MSGEWQYHGQYRKWYRQVYNDQTRQWITEYRDGNPGSPGLDLHSHQPYHNRIDSGYSAQTQPGRSNFLADNLEPTSQRQTTGSNDSTPFANSSTHEAGPHSPFGAQYQSHYPSTADTSRASIPTSQNPPGYPQQPLPNGCSQYPQPTQSYNPLYAYDADPPRPQQASPSLPARPYNPRGDIPPQNPNATTSSHYIPRNPSVGNGTELATDRCYRNANVPRSRRGLTVVGSYRGEHNTHYENLDPTYYVRDSSFFKEGKVFSILFIEPAGTTSNRTTSYNTSLSLVKYNEYAHCQVRRFVVVRAKREFCFACPIFTYGGQGTNKPGVHADEHAIAYSLGEKPTPLEGEEVMEKTPICVVNVLGEPPLQKASRIYFGIHHPIQYNVKVKDLGYVHETQTSLLIQYWNAENRGPSKQSIEETVEPNDE